MSTPSDPTQAHPAPEHAEATVYEHVETPVSEPVEAPAPEHVEAPVSQHVEVPSSHGAEHGAEGGGHGGSSPVSGSMFFWFLTIFVIAALILRKFAFGPILQGLEAREDEIERSLENADRLERELATLEETVQSKLDEADSQARELVDSGREAAREAGKVIEDKAREEAQILRENAERDIASAQGKAENALRATSAELAVEMAMSLLNRELDAKGRKDLADHLIAGM